MTKSWRYFTFLAVVIVGMGAMVAWTKWAGSALQPEEQVSGLDPEAEQAERLRSFSGAPGIAVPNQSTSGWRKLLSFDITQEATREADIGNQTLVLAKGGGSGWDVGVLRYPRELEGENLLYDGNNWHGLQKWHILPLFMTSRHDVRTVVYNKGQSELMIVALDCRTTANGSPVFATGTVEIFHKP